LDRLGGLQTRSGLSGEEKNSHPLPGLEPPVIQPVAQYYTVQLSWLANGEYYTIKCSKTYVSKKNLKKLSLFLAKYYAMRPYCGLEAQFHAFLTSALDGE
jgi:hypothetical protein